MSVFAQQPAFAAKARYVREVAYNARTDARFWLLLVLGIGGIIKIPVVGDLGLADILVVVLVPFFFQRCVQFNRNQPFPKVLNLGLLYLTSLMASDFYRQSDTDDYIRGWAKVFIFLTTIFVLPTIIAGNAWRMAAYALGALMLCLLDFFAVPGLPIFKFYLAVPISGASFIACGFLFSRLGKLSLLFPLVAGLVEFAANARSAAGMTLLALVILSIWLPTPENLVVTPIQRRKKAYLAGFVMLFGAMMILSLYGFSASSGLLGKEGQQKYESQTALAQGSGGPFDVLLGGRNELFFSVPQIMKSPFIGYGSFGHDYEAIREKSFELGITHGNDRDTGKIPTHSFLLQGWVEAGLLGGIFWIYVVILTVRVLISGAYNILEKWGPLFCYVLTQFCWDLLFSPFGGERKVEVGATIVTIEVIMLMNRLNDKANFLRNLPARAVIAQEPAFE